MSELLLGFLKVIIYMIAIKSILGFHWPWEKCSCCGKKWKSHK